MITPIIVLLISTILIQSLIARIVSVWLDMTCFWGRVAYKNPDNIEYKFTVNGWYMFSGILGFAGLIWSVIKLASLL